MEPPQNKTMAWVTYSPNREQSDIDSLPKEEGSSAKKFKKFSQEHDFPTSFVARNEEIYQQQNKKVKKGKSSPSVTNWLSRHNPFKCCCCCRGFDHSKFESDQPSKTYDI